MNYKPEALFRFEKTEGGYSVASYLKTEDTSVTEIEIPEEYNGLPVEAIEEYAFFSARFIKNIVLPKSLKAINSFAFQFCNGLKSVTFNSVPRLGENVFFGCRLLPADVTLMGLVGSCDLSAPFNRKEFDRAFEIPRSLTGIFRLPYNRVAILSPEVFELAIKNDCFRSVDVSVMLKHLIREGDTKSLYLAEKHGMLDDPALLAELAEYSAEKAKTELTAFLLELKKRKFGFEDFEGGSGLEL